MSTPEPAAPRRPRRSTTRTVRPEDIGALVRVLSALQVHLLSGDLPAQLTTSLSRHLATAGLLAPGATPAELLLALDDLAGRLRSGGVRPEVSGETRHLVGFADPRAGRRVRRGCRAPGRRRGRGPGARRAGRWVGDVQWQVTVRVVEPPMSPAFDARIAGLHALADAHAGHLGGWQA